MNSENLILRETEYAPLVNKDDFLDNTDFDSNMINIYDDFVALCVTNGVIAYNISTEYDDTVVNYATYDGKLWKFVNAVPASNVTPGTNESYWIEVFPTELAHRKNSDTILDEGGLNEVSASEIRAFIDAGLTSTTNLSLSEQTDVSLKINSSTGTDVTLLGATETTAGLLNSEDKQKLNQISGINTGDQTLESLGAEATANKVIDFSVIDNITFPTTEAVANKITSDVVDLVDAELTNYATKLYVDENLATKEPTISAGTTSQYWRGDKSWQTLNATAVGLGNVPNTDATNASNLASGTVPTARLGSGTANSTTYLRGDNTWATISAGGLTYFTEAQNSSTPNATVKVDSLTAVASTTDADFSIVPKGAGAFQLAIPDNLTSGGNKRGANSVDLQTFRGNASQVASGSYSVVIGSSNTASSSLSYCIGSANIASNTFSVAIGYTNTSSAYASSAMGGYNNIASGQYSFVGGGHSNTSSGSYALALGYQNIASGQSATSIGYANNVSATGSTGIGWGNTASGSYSIAMGQSCNATSTNSICIGGSASASTASGANSIVLGSGTASASKSIVIGSDGATASAFGAIRIGAYGTSSGQSAISIGYNASSNVAGVSIGESTSSNTGVSIGYNCTGGAYSTALQGISSASHNIILGTSIYVNTKTNDIANSFQIGVNGSESGNNMLLTADGISSFNNNSQPVSGVSFPSSGTNINVNNLGVNPTSNVGAVQQYVNYNTIAVASSTPGATATGTANTKVLTFSVGASMSSLTVGKILRISDGSGRPVTFYRIVSVSGQNVTLDGYLKNVFVTSFDANTTSLTSSVTIVSDLRTEFRNDLGTIVKLYQETTSVTSGTLVSNAGTTLTSTDTIDGYTIQQVVKALRNLGILA